MRGFALADKLRRVAENIGIASGTSPASAALPQTSAELPQSETQQMRGLPQNPQIPQPSRHANSLARPRGHCHD